MFSTPTKCFEVPQYGAQRRKIFYWLILFQFLNFTRWRQNVSLIQIYIPRTVKFCTIWGRCYDHNFQRFLPIFGEKFGAVLKKQCYDQNFA
jgi:hypothetical protein